MKKILLLSAALLLAACSSMRSLPVPADLAVVQPAGTTRWFQIEKLPETGDSGGEASMLAVESSAESLRFVQTNALGAPIARQQLSRNGWQNDGFIAPNAEARRLFAALLPLLAIDKAKQIYPDFKQSESADHATVFSWKEQEMWRVQQSEGRYLIYFPQGSRWLVKEIE